MKSKAFQPSQSPGLLVAERGLMNRAYEGNQCPGKKLLPVLAPERVTKEGVMTQHSGKVSLMGDRHAFPFRPLGKASKCIARTLDTALVTSRQFSFSVRFKSSTLNRSEDKQVDRVWFVWRAPCWRT